MPSLLNPSLWLAGLLLLAGVFSTGVVTGTKWSEGRQAVENNHVAEAVDAALNVSATAISSLKIKNTTITNEVQHEVRTNTIYSDCKLTDRGLQLANQALDSGRTFSLGESKLPNKTDPPK